ncbi:MAG: hypothetical protein ACRCWQ_02450, partial [Bacilli bacterium]
VVGSVLIVFVSVLTFNSVYQPKPDIKIELLKSKGVTVDWSLVNDKADPFARVQTVHFKDDELINIENDWMLKTDEEIIREKEGDWLLKFPYFKFLDFTTITRKDNRYVYAYTIKKKGKDFSLQVTILDTRTRKESEEFFPLDKELVYTGQTDIVAVRQDMIQIQNMRNGKLSFYRVDRATKKVTFQSSVPYLYSTISESFEIVDYGSTSSSYEISVIYNQNNGTKKRETYQIARRKDVKSDETIEPRITFANADKLYVMLESDNTREVYQINRKTKEITTLQAVEETFSERWRYSSVTNDEPNLGLSYAVETENGKNYLSFYSLSIDGRIERIYREPIQSVSETVIPKLRISDTKRHCYVFSVAGKQKLYQFIYNENQDAYTLQIVPLQSNVFRNPDEIVVEAEIEQGILFARTELKENKGTYLMYGIDINTGKILYTLKISNPNFRFLPIRIMEVKR